MLKHAKPAIWIFSFLMSIGTSTLFGQAAQPQPGDASSAKPTALEDPYAPPQDGNVAALVKFIQLGKRRR